MKRDPKKTLLSHRQVPVTALLAALLFSTGVSAGVGESLVLCKINKTVRTLRIEKANSQDAKCLAIYTKQGVDAVIGRAIHKASCERFVEGVRKNLEEAQWSCREVKEARYSNIATETAE